MTQIIKPPPMRALVVDDEPALRHLMIAALTHEGFVCDAAENGAVAWSRVCGADYPYNLVVSDLAMPGRNGHALAVDLLSLPTRPVVAILTGVLEPRIAKDLVARGIDDIVFKPIHYPTFAAKLRGLVNRRKSEAAAPAGSPADAVPRISPEEFEKRLSGLTHIAPLSQCAIEVYKLTSCAGADVEQVTAAIQCDPALIVEVLRLANSAFFNPTPKKITDINQAVVCVGLKRVGELALSTAAFGTFDPRRTPFLSLPRVWRRCLAAGICLEMLIDQVGEARSTGGLFSSAVLQPIGRVLLASLFPEAYESMLTHARRQRKPLGELEAEVLPREVGDITAQTLAAWGVPAEIYELLRYASRPFRGLESVPEPLRRQVELVKTACFFGDAVVGEFESTDVIDLPPASVLKRLRIQTLGPLLAQCRDDLGSLAAFGGDTNSPPPAALTPPPPRRVIYRRLYAGPEADCLAPLLAALNVQLVSPAEATSAGDDDVRLINALDVPAAQATASLRASASPADAARRTIVLTEGAELAAEVDRVIVLPCSVAVLDEAVTPENAAAPVNAAVGAT